MSDLPLPKIYGYNRTKISSLTFDELERLAMYVRENHILQSINENNKTLVRILTILDNEKAAN